MDKNAIKKYAVWARRELIGRVSQRAMKYGISAEDIGDPNAESVNGRLLAQAEKSQRQALIQDVKEKGYNQVMEEVAYTWFNRFAALRFMEVNGYLPSHIRVFTDHNGEFKPQILSEAIHLEMDGLNMEKVYKLENANKSEELFKYLLIVQCNALSKILPGMFRKAADYTELLLPDHILRKGSVIQQMIELIPEEDWMDQVQIIGWLYQYYNTEPKDKVFADLKKNIKITRENIPVATQLFTPDWIVRYLVENSLGRLWLEGHPNDKLKSEWKYCLDEAEQGCQTQLDAIRKEYAALIPEEILCIDPCMGSGHILCYMFDVLIRIYEEYGYTAREAVPLIIEKNLWGLDIDKRAEQLAYFSVMMKAVQYDKRFLRRKKIPQPHVYSPGNYDDGKKFGSLITVDELEPMPQKTEESPRGDEDYETQLSRWNFRRALAQKYHVVVTNPPYMGSRNMDAELSGFLKENFSDYKSDYFSAFFVRCTQMALPIGKLGFFSPYVWMFIQSYEKLRHLFCQQKTIETLIQFEYSAFEEATVPLCAFVCGNYHINKRGCYFRLTDFRGGMEVQQQKTLEAIVNHDCGYYYEQSADNFSKIPGSPIAYWAREQLTRVFKKALSLAALSDFTGSQNKTADNKRFLRYFWEVDKEKIGPGKHWIFYAKGGEYRKHYGNLLYIVDWSQDARDFYLSNPTSNLLDQKYWYKEGITYTMLTSKAQSFRYMPPCGAFDMAGPEICDLGPELHYILAFLNSVVAGTYLNLFNPTLNLQAKDIKALPLVISEEWHARTDQLEHICITLSKADWDSFETSWDFKRHALVRPAASVEKAFGEWSRECENRFNRLKESEIQINRIFIGIYGLQDVLTPEVEDKDVTVRRADFQRDIRSFISYAVGCMLGRYSLDVEGVVYSGGEWDAEKYKTFQPNRDAIITISDDEYFKDDIASRFYEFVRIVYGGDTLEENLNFIATALGSRGNPRAVIRNYFINDFYADHLKVYHKRPIYWLFDSGKKNGFKCLVYMHRYQPGTIARIRTDYVHEQQARYRTAIANLENQINGASASERVKLTRQLQSLQAQSEEVRVYEEKIHHLADKMIRIDLDDGVRHNYEIFGDVLAKIK